MGKPIRSWYDPKADTRGVEPLFYNGDTVWALEIRHREGTRVPVTSGIFKGIVQYVHMPGNKNDARPRYDIAYGTSVGWGREAPAVLGVLETDIEVIERGNWWNYCHQQPLTFNDIVEEAEFYRSIGDAELVRSGDPGGWHMEFVMKAVERGRVDYIVRPGNSLSARGSISAFRLVGHPETSRLIQQHTLETYKDWPERLPRR